MGIPATHELVIASAEAASNTVNTDAFHKLIGNCIKLVGAEIAEHLRADDRPGLLAPVDVELDGNDRLGGVLVLEDRAIIAWTVGTLRIKNFEAVVPRDEISTISIDTRPGGAIAKDREILRLEASDGIWTLVFANVFDGDRSIVPWLQMMLEGAITPLFEENLE